ncbi:MAG: histidine phosphatase family protein [Pseudomonadota bacterium]
MAAPVRADEALLGAVARGEAFAIMRHALAPGTGDPDSFDPDDCATQRNLSEQGRRQAREIGDAFRRAGVSRAAVYSSNWCRCRETARLLGLGAVTILPPLNSFFEAWHRRENQTEAMRDWLASYKGPYPVVLVSHQVNISALTGQGTRSGETVVFQRGADGGIRVTGSF